MYTVCTEIFHRSVGRMYTCFTQFSINQCSIRKVTNGLKIFPLKFFFALSFFFFAENPLTRSYFISNLSSLRRKKNSLVESESLCERKKVNFCTFPSLLTIKLFPVLSKESFLS